MRKEQIIHIMDDGKELTFKLRAMSALKQERFINRVIMLLVGGGKLNNINGLQKTLEKGDYTALLEVFSKLKYEDVEPLYDELLECVEHIPDKGNMNFTNACSKDMIESIVSEVKTLYRLRVEALKINFDFFKGGVNSPKAKQADITITKNM